VDEGRKTGAGHMLKHGGAAYLRIVAPVCVRRRGVIRIFEPLQRRRPTLSSPQSLLIPFFTPNTLLLEAMLLLGIFCVALGTVHATTTIFNGRQSVVFPYDTPQACLDNFNTTLDCDTSFPLLFQQTDLVGWNATNLTA
jgi:hypothetical protein